MAAALGRRNGVAVGTDKSVFIFRPVDGPFQFSNLVLGSDASREGGRRNGGAGADRFCQIVGEAAWEVQEGRFRRVVLFVGDEARVARPANFNAAIEIGFRACHPK